MLERIVFNIVRAYAPQVICEENQKEDFQQGMDKVMRETPEIVDNVLECNMNDYISTVIEIIEVKKQYLIQHQNQRMYERAIMNTYFRKREEYRK